MKKVRLHLLLLLAVILLSFTSLCSAGAEVTGNNDTSVAVESVTLDKTELTLTVGGVAETLTATVLPENATNKAVEWSSSTGAATVANGVVTPVSEGTTVITVKTVDGNKTATCSVTVNASEQNDERWPEWKDTVPPNKVWTITFNTPILRDSISDKNVYVHTNKEKPVNISIVISEDNKSIIINPPAVGYQPGQKYILFVKNKVRTASGKTLTKPIKMMFSVKAAGSSDAVTITGVSEDATAVGKVAVTTAADTTLAAVQAGITMADKQLSWQQVDPKSYTVTIPDAVSGQKYTFVLSAGFTLGTGVDAEVEWAQVTLPFTLTSTAYSANQRIPVKYANTGAGGQNVSIPLTWTGVPVGTKSLALIMYDLNPVANNWVHWAVINIPATATGIPEGASGTAQMPTGSVELNNTFGTCGYGGPEPPSGSGDHQYKTVIYALNVDQINLSGAVTQAQFEAAVSGISLGSAELTGVFSL